MRMLPRILSLLAVASLALFFVNCGTESGGEDPAEKTQLAQLSKTWTLNTVTLDGVDRKSDFDDNIFKLTISGSFNESKPKGPYAYSVSGTRPSPNPWPPTAGTWEFGSDPIHDIIRKDLAGNVAMNYTVTSTSLSISFNYTGEGFEGSRVSEVSGNWVFTFN